ncbi:unnamed protein product, partial [Pylaiella littoralis]
MISCAAAYLCHHTAACLLLPDETKQDQAGTQQGSHLQQAVDRLRKRNTEYIGWRIIQSKCWTAIREKRKTGQITTIGAHREEAEMAL